MVQWKRIGRSFDRWVQVYVAIIATYGVILSRSSSGLNISKPTVNQSEITNTFGHLSVILTVPNVLIATGVLLTLINYLLKRRERKSIQVADPSALESQRIATDDAQRITERIHLEQPFKVEGIPQLTAVDPFIEFSVGVRNSSVLTLDVEREVEGRIRIDNNQELRQPLEIQKYPLAAIKHGDYRPIIFRQWLSAEAAAQIRHQRTTIFDAGHLAIHFIVVQGDKRWRQRIALGNQLPWNNLSPDGWQALTACEYGAVKRIAQLVSPTPQSVLVVWDRGAEKFAFDLYAALCAGGWNARVEPYIRGFPPEPHDGSIQVFGKSEDGIAHDLLHFLMVVFGEYPIVFGSTLALPANVKDDIHIIVGSR